MCRGGLVVRWMWWTRRLQVRRVLTCVGLISGRGRAIFHNSRSCVVIKYLIEVATSARQIKVFIVYLVFVPPCYRSLRLFFHNDPRPQHHHLHCDCVHCHIRCLLRTIASF